MRAGYAVTGAAYRPPAWRVRGAPAREGRNDNEGVTGRRQGDDSPDKVGCPERAYNTDVASTEISAARDQRVMDRLSG